jgi:hypothetical protein
MRGLVSRLPRDRRTRLFACALAAGIAAVLGWIVVPNSVVAHDTPDVHMRASVAAALAATPWPWNFASGAARRPVWSAFGLAGATYLSGVFALMFCGVPYNQMGNGGPDVLGFLFAYVPWLLAGAFFWSAGMLVLDQARRLWSRSAAEEARWRWSQWLRLAAAALCVGVLLFGLVGPDIRHMGWTAPNPPEARRHAITAPIPDGSPPGAECHAGAVEGAQLPDYIGKCRVAYLYMYTDTTDGWRFYFGKPYWAPVTCWQPAGYFPLYHAWDEGDSLILWFGNKDYGVVVPKASDYTTDIGWPTYQGTMIIYISPTLCLDDAGHVVFLTVRGGE